VPTYFLLSFKLQAQTLVEVGILDTVFLRVSSGTILPIFVKIGSYLTEKEQKISWHSYFETRCSYSYYSYFQAKVTRYCNALLPTGPSTAAAFLNAQYTPPTRLSSTVESRHRRRCVLGFIKYQRVCQLCCSLDRPTFCNSSVTRSNFCRVRLIAANIVYLSVAGLIIGSSTVFD